MKKILFFGIFALGIQANGQNNMPAHRTCATDILPQQYETWIQGLTPPINGKGDSQNSVQSIFYIPVIVHVIHNNEAVNSNNATSGNNLSALQIQNQIDILNKDFNGTNPDTNLIPAIFKPLLGKFQIYFCMAVVNPTGGVLPEPGIDRINRVSKGWTASPYSTNYVTATIKPNSIWDPNRYMNMWVCSMSGGILGYATFPNPGTSGLAGLSAPFGTATTDGVVILNTAFGSIGTAGSGQYNKGRTATHEIGHWMGLRHVWGDGTCATDYCNDTPPAQTSNYNCPSFPYHVGTCAGNTTGEMTMNYMDYTDDACMYMFSADQKNRAQLILTNSPMRLSLITSTVCNLPAVGNDIALTFVSSPTYSQVFSCVTSINPVVNITNFGSTNLTSALFSYNVNGVNTQTLNWTGNLAPNTSTTVALGTVTNLSGGYNTFSVNVSAPNGATDNNLNNNNSVQQFYISGSSFTLTPASASICAGSLVNVSATGAASYSWSNGSTSSNVVFNPTITTTYTVTGGSGNCASTKTISVFVYQNPIAAVTSTDTKCSTSCDGIVTLSPSGGTAPYTYSISGIGATNSTKGNLCAGSYSYSVKDSKGCTVHIPFTINSGTFVVAVSTTSSNITCGSCTDGTASAMATNGSGPYTYTWMPGNYSTSSVNNLGAGCYTVTVADVRGCANSDEVCMFFDTGILNQTFITESIKVVPNPNNGIFKLEFSNSNARKIEITNVLGQLIAINESNSTGTTIDISAFSDGVYYAKISNENKITVLKVVKN